MASFLGEIRRRKVFQVAAAYAVVSWLLIQVITAVEAPLSLPAWFDTAVIVLLAAGFPIAVLVAWAVDLTPRGIEVTGPAPAATPSGFTRAQGLGVAMQGLVLVAVAFLVVDQYVLRSGGSGSTPVIGAHAGGRVTRFVIDVGPTEPIGNTRLDAHVAISRDGRYIVYAAQNRGTVRLYRRSLDSLESEPLAGTEGAYWPFVSPDGEWVGFYSDATDQKLKKVSVRGGPPQALADTPLASGADWRRADQIVYATMHPNGGRGLFSIESTGGMPDPILVPESLGGFVWPSVLPGGARALFSTRPEGTGIADGYTATVEIASGAVGERLLDAAYNVRYAPSGHLVFVRSGSIWAAPFDADTAVLTGPPVPIVDGVQSDPLRGGAGYAFSDDGTLVYVPGADTIDFRRQLVRVRQDGSEQVLFPEENVFGALKLSPDGRRLAYQASSGGGGGGGELWVLDLEAQATIRLVGTTTIGTPVWSPDGRSLYFGNLEGVFATSADGTSDPKLIYSDGERRAFYPYGLLQDGSGLIYTQIRGSSDIYMVELGEEPTRRRLTTTPFDEYALALSPDNHWIAYGSNETGQEEIYVRPFPMTDGSGKWRISINGGRNPTWSRQGDAIYFRSLDGSLMVVDVDTSSTFMHSPPQLRLTDPSAAGYASYQQSYDVSPDGTSLVRVKSVDPAAATLRTTRLVVVQNWFEEVRRRTQEIE